MLKEGQKCIYYKPMGKVVKFKKVNCIFLGYTRNLEKARIAVADEETGDVKKITVASDSLVGIPGEDHVLR